MHTYNEGERVALNPAGGYRRIILADQATTTQTAAAVTGLAFPIKAGEVWNVECAILTTGVSGGGKFSVSGPASPSILTMTLRGLTSGITAYSTDRVTAVDTLSAAYNTSAVTGYVFITIVFGAIAAGTVQLNFANVTSTNSFAALAGSTLIATRLV